MDVNSSRNVFCPQVFLMTAFQMHLGLVHLGYMPLWLPCVLSLSTKFPNPNQNAVPISTYAVPILFFFNVSGFTSTYAQYSESSLLVDSIFGKFACLLKFIVTLKSVLAELSWSFADMPRMVKNCPEWLSAHLPS